VWGYRPGVMSRTVFTTIGRVRQKLEVDPHAPTHLVTVAGRGYQWASAAARRGPARAARGAHALVGRQELVESRGRVARGGEPGVADRPGRGPARPGWRSRCCGAGSGSAVFVALEPLDRAGAVPEAIAAALGVRLGGRSDPWGELADSTDGPVLVALDNAEHLVGLAEPLSRWLGACPTAAAAGDHPGAAGAAGGGLARGAAADRAPVGNHPLLVRSGRAPAAARGPRAPGVGPRRCRRRRARRAVPPGRWQPARARAGGGVAPGAGAVRGPRRGRVRRGAGVPRPRPARAPPQHRRRAGRLVAAARGGRGPGAGGRLRVLWGVRPRHRRGRRGDGPRRAVAAGRRLARAPLPPPTAPPRGSTCTRSCASTPAPGSAPAPTPPPPRRATPRGSSVAWSTPWARWTRSARTSSGARSPPTTRTCWPPGRSGAAPETPPRWPARRGRCTAGSTPATGSWSSRPRCARPGTPSGTAPTGRAIAVLGAGAGVGPLVAAWVDVAAGGELGTAATIHAAIAAQRGGDLGATEVLATRALEGGASTFLTAFARSVRGSARTWAGRFGDAEDDLRARARVVSVRPGPRPPRGPPRGAAAAVGPRARGPGPARDRARRVPGHRRPRVRLPSRCRGWRRP
jgi:hypothetical protein